MKTAEGVRCQRLLAMGIILSLAAGLLLRWLTLDVMLFDFDEGIASLYAYQLVGKGILPLRGVKTSLEFYNPPFFIYLISIPYCLSRLPTVAVGFLQLLQIGAVGGLCRVLWREQLQRGALLVAVFGALTPGPFWLTARLWGHAVIPVFSVLAFVCVHATCRRPRCVWAALLLPPAVAAAQQSHFSGALLLPMAAVALFLLRARIHWRYFGAGLLLALFMYIPYFGHLWQTGFADARTIMALLTAEAGPGRHPTPMWSAAAHTFFDFGTNTALQEHFALLRRGLPPAYLYPTLWVSLLQVLRIRLYSLRQQDASGFGSDLTTKQGCEVLVILSVIWCVVPLLGFSLPRVELVPAYWLVALPGPWVLLASLTRASDLGACTQSDRHSQWTAWRYRISDGLVAILVVVTSVSSVIYHIRYVRLMRDPDPAVVAYPPYRDQRDAVWFVCEHSHGARVRLTQEDRSETVGVDYQILYLIAAREGNALRFSPEAPETPQTHYVIHNRARRLPRVVTAGETVWERQRFGLLDVYWRSVGKSTSKTSAPSD